MEDRNSDYWIKRAFDFAREMGEAGLDATEIATIVSFLAAAAVHKTDSPLFAYEAIIVMLTGAAEDERRTQPDQPRMGVV